ncbi:MAG: zf-HC2 domain-containing protein [Kiritimatiellae bacterium]|nr:zf-HC2 domain-containing protein [Kiritimatiellia bacterium]
MKIIRCADIEELLTAYLMGELDPARTRLIRAHVERCARCRRSVAELESTLKVLRRASASSRGIPSHLERTRVEQILHAGRHPLTRWLPRHFMLIAVVVVAAILLNLFFVMRRRPPPEYTGVEVQIAPPGRSGVISNQWSDTTNSLAPSPGSQLPNTDH